MTYEYWRIDGNQQFAKWERETQYGSNAYMCIYVGSRKWYRCTRLQSRNGDISRRAGTQGPSAGGKGGAAPRGGVTWPDSAARVKELRQGELRCAAPQAGARGLPSGVGREREGACSLNESRCRPPETKAPTRKQSTLPVKECTPPPQRNSFPFVIIITFLRASQASHCGQVELLCP